MLQLASWEFIFFFYFKKASHITYSLWIKFYFVFHTSLRVITGTWLPTYIRMTHLQCDLIFPFLFFFCVWYIYVCAYLCGGVLAHACAWRGQRQTSDIFPGSLLYFRRQGFSLSQELNTWDRLTSQQAHGTSLCPVSSALGYSHARPCLAFMWILEMEHRLLLYPRSHLSRPCSVSYVYIFKYAW